MYRLFINEADSALDSLLLKAKKQEAEEIQEVIENMKGKGTGNMLYRGNILSVLSSRINT